MAINKMRTSPMMKAGVIVLIVAFIGTVGAASVFSLIADNNGTNGGVTGRNTGAAQTSGSLQQIAQNAQGQIAPLEQQLKTNPKDYTTLKTLGDDYYNYASEVASASPGAGLDVTIWRQAADYYKRALAVKPGDPNVATDMSICEFYSGDTSAAIATVEAVLKADPKFPQAIFNSGIYYKSAGQNAKAIAAFQEYLRVAPSGDKADAAKGLLSQVQAAGASTNTTGK